MSKVNVVYWSQSGNTQAMAEAIAEGADGTATFVSDADMNDLKNANAFALGCPAMGAEVLEESEMEPFVIEVEGIASGKTIALFGSYGWGDGQWMRDWVERMEAAGANVIGGEDLICQEAPDADMIASLKRVGEQLAAL